MNYRLVPPASGADPRLSIIIVTYNPGEILFACLESLQAGVGALPSEVILVDNASENDVVVSLSAFRVIQNTENRGFAAANNQGMAAARGAYFVLVNPDVLLRPGALARMAECLDTHACFGIAGPRTYDRGGRLTLTGYGPYTPISILSQYLGMNGLFPYHGFGRYRRASEVERNPFEVAWVQGSCMMIRRAVYEQIGGLDEALFLFAEEPDYCERAKAAGWHTVHVPAAEIEHHESTTISNYPLVKMRHYHRSPLHYFRKRHKPLSVLILKLGFTLELGIKMLLRFLQLTWIRDRRLWQRLAAYPVTLRDVWRF